MAYLKRCEDKETEVNQPLCGKYIRSFAYPSLKDRIPIILTNVIDYLSRNKESIVKEYGENSREELKTLIGGISKLKSELQTNKPLVKLESSGEGVEHYNKLIEEETKRMGEDPTFFYTGWLLSECYLYRRIEEIVQSLKHLKGFDVFEHQKIEVFHNSKAAIKDATVLTLDAVRNARSMSQEELKKKVIDFFKFSLWSNRADLSLSAGAVEEQKDCLHLDSLDKFILVDDSEKGWEALIARQSNGHPKILDIVLDNAGFELFFDLCLAHLLIAANIVSKVRFFTKNIPWFVSDTNPKDFLWMIQATSESDDDSMRAIGEKWQNFLSEGKFEIAQDPFWTLPYGFDKMQSVSPSLYKKLGESVLVIFKGDLNYRKLVNDINRPYTTPFKEALMSFHPNKILSLRTMKCDVAAGLKPGQAEACAKIKPNWIITGDFATIQFDQP